MAVKLELKPEIEAGLAAQARAHGLSLEAYLDQVLRSAAHVFVVRQGEEWAVRKPNAEYQDAIFPTQAEAIKHATSKRRVDRKSLSQLFAESPLKGLDLKFERDPDIGRPVKL